MVHVEATTVLLVKGMTCELLFRHLQHIPEQQNSG
jgi:hypothetical protein